jgi:hypothetical protein
LGLLAAGQREGMVLTGNLAIQRPLWDVPHPRHRPGRLLISALATFVIYFGIFLLVRDLQPKAMALGVARASGDAISVSLLGSVDGHASPSSNSVPPPPADALLQDVARANPESLISVKPEASPAHTPSLSDLFDVQPSAATASPAARAGGGSSLATPPVRLSGDQNTQVSLANAAGLGVRATSASSGATYPSCWRRAANPLPVKMIAILDTKGMMIGPPRVTRSNSAPPGSDQLRAEAQAMQAMAGCAPYSLTTTPGMYRSFELDFSRSTNWITPLGPAQVQ